MQINGRTDSVAPVLDGRVQPALQAKSARPDGADPAAARKVAREFEAMFVAQMMKSMRETVGKDTLTGGGRAEETFRSLLDQEYAAEAARSGGIGLAQSIERELLPKTAAPLPPKEANHAD